MGLRALHPVSSAKRIDVTQRVVLETLAAVELGLLARPADQKFADCRRHGGAPFRSLNTCAPMHVVVNCDCDIFHAHILTLLGHPLQAPHPATTGLFARGGEILREASDRAAALWKHCSSGGEDLLVLLALLALRPDIPVERHGFDPELSAECGHGGVDLRVHRRAPKAHTSGGEVLHGVEQMGEVAAETVELPDHENVALPQGAQAAVDSGRSSRTPEAKSW